MPSEPSYLVDYINPFDFPAGIVESRRSFFFETVLLSFIMINLLSFVFLTLSLSTRAKASIGPSAQLVISNANISPDGYERSWVYNAWY